MIPTIETATVYRGGGRRWFSLRAACGAEARAVIKARYPSEKADYESGHMTYPGFYWRDLPNAEKMLRRLTRAYVFAAKSAAGKEGS